MCYMLQQHTHTHTPGKPHQEYAGDHIRGYLGVGRVVVSGGRSQVVVEAGLQQSHQGLRMLLDAPCLPGKSTGDVSVQLDPEYVIDWLTEDFLTF